MSIKMKSSMLPAQCCRNVARNGEGPYRACPGVAVAWYLHCGNVCSYCKVHDYRCGDKIVRED